MSNEITNHWAELFKIIADEVNVKNIRINGQLVHSDPLLKDKYKDKQRQFNEIYK